MTEQLAHDVLRRMASPPPPAPDDVPLTSSKAVRLAITRAADKTHDMVVSVSSLQEEVLTLETLLETLTPEEMLLAMKTDGRAQGITAIGLELRAALLELQTIGRVLELPAEEREPTQTDAWMSEPLIMAFLAHLQITAAQTPLDGWGAGFEIGERFSSPRAAGLILDDRLYRVIRISLDLWAGERTSEMSIALPTQAKTAEKVVNPVVAGDWEAQFQTVVSGSAAKLDAQLHRFSLPLFKAENLAVGQVIPLPGCTVSSVKLLARDGRKVATARLGQSGGMRAVRVEAAPHLQMEDMDNLGATAVGQLSGLDGMDAAPAMEMGADLSFAPEVDSAEPPAFDMAAMDAPAKVALDVGEAADPAPLSWDDEDLEATPETGEAAPLDWSNEDFEPPT